ncbi:Metal-dependent hydrolase of the beta-lactamase superfamily [Methanonatronarchaeum thermophilum]|uniref:Metal-dependent hydrolase of the beta-lactamase superfamily n=1 Tax=Methanonatronarchaeum thermophilum TaxID=1927129 RepID=A0A1Y3GC31_9EURY|nr:MBL fold metallo-hydrolase [Methanonatronarchaeum thermophilum]OUJ18800.1 Metal-dependent hydrolase of the beta-lactamase superfamily [Methanonatronarchaeum thermophilum]
MEIRFLGTGGGRFTTMFQKRFTGGFRIDGFDNYIHLDPGPGALLLSNQLGLSPIVLNAIVLSHAHPDHYTDVEPLIEAMTKAGTRDRGVLLSSKSGVETIDGYGPVISKYHRDMAGDVKVLDNDLVFELKNKVKIKSFKVHHSDPSSCGVRVETPNGDIGYTGDTTYFDKLPNKLKGVRVLIMNVTRPLNSDINYHLSTNEAIKLISKVQPEIAIMTHFGYNMLESGVEEQACIVQGETDVDTIAAEDFMKVVVEKEIKTTKRQSKLIDFKAI